MLGYKSRRLASAQFLDARRGIGAVKTKRSTPNTSANDNLSSRRAQRGLRGGGQLLGVVVEVRLLRLELVAQAVLLRAHHLRVLLLLSLVDRVVRNVLLVPAGAVLVLAFWDVHDTGIDSVLVEYCRMRSRAQN